LSTIGSVVKKRQRALHRRSDKLMNEIRGRAARPAVEALVQNGQPVEYGEALFRFEPA